MANFHEQFLEIKKQHHSNTVSHYLLFNLKISKVVILPMVC
jgi:hypothetical protein